MEASVDAALGRVALVLRVIAAVWMVLLSVTYGLSNQGLDHVGVAVGVTTLGVVWAFLAWASGWMRRAEGEDWGLLATDLVVTSLVILIPALVNETKGYTGGFPFAALVVGLAAAGRRGVIVATAVLSGCTLIALALVGGQIGPFVVTQLLLYVLGAVALSIGINVLRETEQRVRQAESALLVAEERAATATHLHDSVLQTLALMQRRADDAGSVRSLAKRQERELREWLFPTSTAPTRLGSALEVHAEDIEERYGVAVRVITVGGTATIPLPTDERDGLCALVKAAREAMVNAAVHSGAAQVDVFAETDDGQVAVFVRDRGQGFDLKAIPADRQGVRGSIIRRMDRAGGTARISTSEKGTEVRLKVALRDQDVHGQSADEVQMMEQRDGNR